MNVRNIACASLITAYVVAGGLPAQETKAKPRGKRTRRKPAVAMQPTKQIVYKTTKNADGAEVKLRLHVFEPPGHKPSDKRPTAVFFFGGGWVGGSPSQFYAHGKYLASRGMLAVSAEYRVRSRNGTTPFECVADGKSAIRYVRAHARELGADPNRIVAGGGSAGGHVAAATGTLPGLDEPSEDASASSAPNAMVLFNPVIDCGPEGSYGHARVRARWKEICPTHNVSKKTPPTLLLHGTGDKTVRYADAEGFVKAAKAAGARCELIGYEGQGHGFFNFGRGGYDHFIRTVEAADKFLAGLGYLKGEPAVKEFVARMTRPQAKRPAASAVPERD